MTGVYLVDLADWLRAEGLDVVEYPGWQTRGRSSGGFPYLPLGVQWHHTAGDGSNPQGEADYLWRNSDSAPVGNLYLERDGTVWVGCAGASNTAGKGGPWMMSRGVVPVDQGNTTTVAIEAANTGIGQAWPTDQVDAYFAASNAINRHLGNTPGDLFTHAAYAPGRKIDPATAAAVAGDWRPAALNSSGTWTLDDIVDEAYRRTEVPDVPLTDDDINRIADAVWRRAIALKTGTSGETRPAGDLLGWTHANAEQANKQIQAHRSAVETGE